MIRQLRGTVIKETILLLRDRAGLAVLFVMPMVLIILMVIIQDRTFHFLQDVRVPVLWMNADSGKFGQDIRAGLDNLEQIQIVDSLENRKPDADDLQGQVAAGNFKAAIYLPPGFSHAVEKNTSDAQNKLRLYFDPAINQNLKLLIQTLVRADLTRLELRLMREKIQEQLVLFGPQAQQLLPDLNMENLQKGRLDFKTIVLTRSGQIIMPNSVQHNVPGWTLFAMFFIVIPLAGSMISERDSGTLQRLFSMPASGPVLLIGRGMVYLIVCVLQFLLMVAIGKWGMPILGFSALQTGSHYSALAMVVLSAALAAIGFGLFVGSWAKTYQQASSFGAIAVLIAAALGGIWVPVFIMPHMMQTMSALSPLNWGLQAFHEVFLRDGDLAAVSPQIVKLMLFFLFTSALAWYKFRPAKY